MEEQVSIGQFAKKWGVIYGLSTTIINFTPILLEKQMQWIALLNVVVAFLAYILAMNEFKNENGGFISFGEGFKISLIAGLIAGAIRSVVIYIYVKSIDQGYAERMRQAMRNVWEEQGMTEEQIAQASKFSGIFLNPEAGLFLGVISVLFGALIWGSISAAIVKKERENF